MMIPIFIWNQIILPWFLQVISEPLEAQLCHSQLELTRSEQSPDKFCATDFEEIVVQSTRYVVVIYYVSAQQIKYGALPHILDRLWNTSWMACSIWKFGRPWRLEFSECLPQLVPDCAYCPAPWHKNRTTESRPANSETIAV